MASNAHSGLGGQVVLAEESTYGVYAAPTKSFEFVSESMKLVIERIPSKGLRAGRRIVGKWQPGKRVVSGDLDLEVAGTGFGLMLKHCLGGIATTGAGPAYTHTATHADLPTGLTIQVGKPSIDGTVQPFTYLGCRVNTWDLSVKAGELLMLKPSFVAQDESSSLPAHAGTATGSSASTLTGAVADNTSATNDAAGRIITAGASTGTVVSNTAGASPVWTVGSWTGGTPAANAAYSLSPTIGLAAFTDLTATAPLLSFVGGTVTLGGTQVDLLDFTLKGDNKLDAGRFRLGRGGLVKQPLESSWRTINGTLTADFEALTQYNHYLNADELSMVATFAGPTIVGGGVPYSVVVTANVRYDGTTPNVAGPAELSQPLTVEVIGSGATDALAMSIAYTSTDSSP